MPAARKIPAPSLPPATATPTAIWAGIILLSVFLAYANTFKVPFIFDDIPGIEDNKSIRTLWPLGPVLQPPSDGGTGVSGRPIVNLSLALNYAISGKNPWSYHVANTLIHGLAALALFGVVRRTLTGPVLREKWGAHATPVAFAGALLWALHPLQTESVTCAIQRTESLVGLFYLLTLYAFARAAAAPAGPGRAGWATASVVACALGMATKEVMVTAPVIALLYDRTFVSGSFRGVLRQRWLHYGLVATWALLFYLLQGNPLRGGTAGFTTVTWWDYLLTQCRGIVIYLKLTLWPHPLVLDYGTTVVRRLPEVLPQAILLVALALGTIWACWRRPVLGFLGAWFFIILSPSSSVVPLVTQTIAEHRIYLPLAAVVLLGVGALALRAPRLVLPVSAGLALALGVTTFVRNQVFRDPKALWLDNLAKCPDNPRAYASLASYADRAENTAESIAYYAQYIVAKPEDEDALFNYARNLAKAGRREEALPHFEKILQKTPGQNVVRINYATALLALRRTDEAIQQFEFILRVDRKPAQNHFNLAEALMTAGRTIEAVASYRQAVTIKQDNSFMFYRYADALLKVRRLGEAVEAYRSAVALQPDLHPAWTNLGGALMMMDRPRDAIPAYEAALRLKPGDPQSRQNLAYARSLGQ